MVGYKGGYLGPLLALAYALELPVPPAGARLVHWRTPETHDDIGTEELDLAAARVAYLTISQA